MGDPHNRLAAEAAGVMVGRVLKSTQSIPGAQQGEAASGDFSLSNGGRPVVAGDTLGGKYRLISEIGRGGMGSVWRAEHLGWEAPVAVKLMNRSDQPEALARFEREVRLAAGLRSPHVVQVLDHGIDEETRAPFIAMELLEGETLARRLKRQTRLSPAETFLIVSQLSRALTRAHAAGIVHRDLKPDNVFLVRNDEEIVTKVLDFGVAKWTAPTLPREGLTRPGNVLGTPFYMSPEQIQGSSEIDHRADLWSLSTIACECLTGKRPFEAKDFAQLAVLLIANQGRRAPSSLGPVPVGFDAWFARATDSNINRRFQDARELVRELAPLCGAVAQLPFDDAGGDTEELPGAQGPASMSAVSRTAAPGFAPKAFWRRPVARFAASTAASFLVVSSGIAYWYRDMWSTRRDAPTETTAAALQAAAPYPAAAASQAADPTASPRAFDGALPAVRPPSSSASVDPSPSAALPPSALAPVESLPAALPGMRPLSARPSAQRPKTPRAKPRASKAAAPSPASEAEAPAGIDVNGRQIRTTLTPTP